MDAIFEIAGGAASRFHPCRLRIAGCTVRGCRKTAWRCCAAIAHGYGIECDIQRAMDGTPMVFHDYELGRLTGETNGTVAASTPAQLARPAFRHDEAMSTLAEMLAEVAGRVPLLIEIKDPDAGFGGGMWARCPSAWPRCWPAMTGRWPRSCPLTRM